MLFKLFQENADAFIELVVDRLVEHDSKSGENRDEFKKRVRKLLFWIIERSCFGPIKRISLAVGHSELSETYREVFDKDPCATVALRS